MQPSPNGKPRWRASVTKRASLPDWPGLLAGLFLCALILGPLAAVALRAGGGGWPMAADWAALRFTVLQAVLSAVISVALAVPVARALARRRFPGRGVLITLLGAPFILPVIVAVLGLLAVFGRGGVLNDALLWLGLPRVQIYGLHGVVLAHVFFNLPLATRMILQSWQAIPAEASDLYAFDAASTYIQEPPFFLDMGLDVSPITSIEGARAAPGYAAYAAAKAGVINYTKTASFELAPHRIRVNALAPDLTMTEGLRGLTGGGLDGVGGGIPMRRAGDVDEMAAAAVFLASDMASYVTGQTIHVDGGTEAAGGWYFHPQTGEATLGPG